MNPNNPAALVIGLIAAISERDKRAREQQAAPPPPTPAVGNVAPVGGRTITPAPVAPPAGAPPVVTALPRVGTGPAPAQNPFAQGRYNAPPAGGAGPETPAVLPPSLTDQLGGFLAGKRDDFAASAVGAPVTQGINQGISELNKVPQLVGISNPLHIQENPADILKLTLETAQGKVIQELGNDAYKYVSGGFGADGSFGKTVAENIPFKRQLFEWADQNKALVNDVYRNGFYSRDGDERYFGGRAVWEAFARENLTFDPAKGAGNIPAVLTGLVTDPLNIIGGPAGKTGRGLIEGGEGLMRGGNALQKVGGAAMTGIGLPLLGADVALSEIPLAATGKLINPIKNGARKTRIGAQVGRWFEESPRAKAERTLNDILHWRSQDKAARSAAGAQILDPNAISRGDLSETTPVNILDPGISGPDTPSYIPHEFDGAERITTSGGAVVGLPKSKRGSKTRTVSDGAGNALARIKQMGSRADRWFTVTTIGPDGKLASRGTSFDTFDEAVKSIDGLLNPAAPAPDPGVIANPLEEAAAAVAEPGVIDNPLAVAEEAIPGAPPRRITYGENFRDARKSSSRIAEQVAVGRMQRLIDAAPDEETRGMIQNLTDEMLADRNDIFSSMQGGRPSTNPLDGSSVFIGNDSKPTDMRNLANRFEAWSREFAHYVTGADILEYKGASLPAYVNEQGKNTWAAKLDTLAWNPDEAAADAARADLLGYRQKVADAVGEDAHAVFNMDEAIDLATSNRERFGATLDEGVDDAVDLVDEADVPALGIPEPDPADIAPPDPAPWRATLNEGDRAALEAGLAAGGSRANTFKVADQRLAMSEGTMQRLVQGGDDEAYDAAVLSWQEANANMRRVLESAKREDDYLEEQFRNGAISTPDVMEVLQRGVDATHDAFQAADESFVLPAILSEQAETGLARTFENNSNRVGQTYGDVYRDIEGAVGAEKNRLVMLESLNANPKTKAALTTKENAELNRLRKAFNTEGLDAARKIDVEHEFRFRLKNELFTEYGYAGPGKWGSKFDTAGRIFSTINLLAPWKFPQYYLGNLVGDSAQIFLTEGPAAVFAANDPRLVADMTKYAFKGGDVTAGSLGDLVRDAGLGGFHQSLVSDNLTEAIYKNEAKAINRAAGSSRFNLIGKLDEGATWATGWARNIQNGMEWSHRTGMYGWKFKQGIINSKAGYATEMAEYAKKYGIEHADIMAVLDQKLVVDGSKIAKDMSELAIARGADMKAAEGFGVEMGRRWANNVYHQDELARKAVDGALFDYSMKNIDVALRRVMPYHFWASRAIPFFAEQALRHPGYAAAYYNAYQATTQLADEQGWPGPLKTMTAFMGGPAGLMLTVNPLAMIGLLDYSFEANGGYTDENVSAVGKVLNSASEYGFSLLPWWGAAMNYAGLMGDSPTGLDPIGTYNARKFLGSMIQWAQAEGIGGGTPQLMGKPFDQALQQVRGMVSGKLSGILPGAEYIPPSDANAGPQVQVRNTMLRNELAERGMTMNQYLQLIQLAEEDTTGDAAVALEELHQSIIDDEMDGNVAYQIAVREVARGNALMNTLSGMLPGPKMVRQEDQLQIQTLSNAYFNNEKGEPAVIPGVGPIPEYDPAISVGGAGFSVSELDTLTNEQLQMLDRRDVDFLKAWEERFGSEYRAGDIKRLLSAGLRANSLLTATPQAATLLEGQAGWYNLGSERENALLDTYYSIAYGEGDANIPSQGVTFTAEDLQQYDQDGRYAIADLWLADHDPDGEVANLKELRDLYAETHPEYGEYRTWASETRKQWGNPTAFRMNAVTVNPSYAQFIRDETVKARTSGKTPSEIEAELDQAAFSVDGYMAYSGITRSRYAGQADTGVIPPLPLASQGATGTGMGGDGSGGGGSSTTDLATDVQTALLEVQAARQAQYDYLGTTLDQVPPEIASMLAGQPGFPDAAQMPESEWLYREYMNFRAEAERKQTDASIAAFVRAYEQEQGLPAGASQRYQKGVWPPQPVA